MSTPSAVHPLLKPMRSLQETCASLLAVKRGPSTSGVKAAAKRPAAAGALDDDMPTQWPQTSWSETSFEPRMP